MARPLRIKFPGRIKFRGAFHYPLLLETPLGNLSGEIGERYGVSESGVSQASQRIWIRQKNDKKLAKLITKMVKGPALLNV